MPCLMIFFFCFNYWSPVVIHLFFSEVCSCLSSLFGKTFPCWWIFILSGGGSQKVGTLREWIHFPMGFACSPILWIHVSFFPLVSHRHFFTRLSLFNCTSLREPSTGTQNHQSSVFKIRFFYLMSTFSLFPSMFFHDILFWLGFFPSV